jgi:transglutaminase-like putative cysteine protease
MSRATTALGKAVASATEATLAGATVAITGLVYGGFFAGQGYLPPLVAAAGGAAAVAALAAWRRWRVIWTSLAAILGLALLATWAIAWSTLDRGLPTARTATALGPDLLHGWARMLTVSLPADPTGALLATPVAVTWVASFVAVTLVLRTRAMFTALLPGVLALGVSLVLTAGQAGLNVPVTVAFMLAGLLLILVRAIRTDTAGTDTAGTDTAGMDTVDRAGAARTSRGRLVRIGFGLPVVATFTALGVAGAGLVPLATTDRFDPRTVVPLRFDTGDTLTPLVTLKSQLRQQPARPLFTVRVQDAAGIPLDRVRTAALDRFDGAVWTSDDRYLAAGRTLAPDPSLTGSRRARIHVDIEGLPGPYLPVVGWPVRVGATGVGFSDTSGVLVSSGSLPGLGYDLVGEVRSREGLDSAVPSIVDGASRYTALPPGLPPEVAAVAAQLTAPAARPYAKLTAIEGYLRKLPYSLEARPGHSYDAIRRLFGSNPQDRVGYAEQYASAFAVLARSQGFPTRVAVGYLLRPGERRGDTYRVTTADAHAWPEVYLAGHGWVSFEPTDFTVVPNPPTKQPPTAPAPGANGAGTPNTGSHAIEDPNLGNGRGTTGSRVLSGSLLGLVVLAGTVVVLILAVLLEKRRRRWRRRRGGGRNARVIGAWRDTADRLVEHGVRVPASMTAREVADHAEQRLGTSAGAVAVLAPLVTAAVFCPAEPTDDEVRTAWQLNSRLRRELRQGRGWWRSARAWFDPRPLLAGRRDRRRRRRSLEALRRG